MAVNDKEIYKYQQQQKQIKDAIQQTKEKLPTYFTLYILITVLGIYFLENYLYTYFKSSTNFILFTISVCTLAFLVFMFRIFLQILKKRQQSKAIGIKIYKLMKLEEEVSDN